MEISHGKSFDSCCARVFFMIYGDCLISEWVNFHNWSNNERDVNCRDVKSTIWSDFLAHFLRWWNDRKIGLMESKAYLKFIDRVWFYQLIELFWSSSIEFLWFRALCLDNKRFGELYLLHTWIFDDWHGIIMIDSADFRKKLIKQICLNG